MSATFYDLLKYAKTGIAAPDMTAYDKMRAMTAAGGKVKTLTGVPPLSFKSNGKPLISWSMKGNGQQTGTPAPDNPIYPQFVGDRTGNLAHDISITYVTTAYSNALLFDADLKPNTTYTLSFVSVSGLMFYTNENIFTSDVIFTTVDGLNTITITTVSEISKSQTAQAQNGLWRILKNRVSLPITPVFDNVMFNEGSTAKPYEPYGYKIPITNAGQTQNVYLGQTQTVRRVRKLVLDGTEDWSNQTVHTTTSVSIVKPANGVLRPKTVLILSSDFIATDEASQSNPFVVGKMYVGSYYISFNYDGANNLDTWKSHLAERYASGNPICIWYVLAEPITAIVNEPLCKIGDYADELHSADAGVSIPTAKGANTLTVDTDLKPSSMTITYCG